MTLLKGRTWTMSRVNKKFVGHQLIMRWQTFRRCEYKDDFVRSTAILHRQWVTDRD